jgi:hypothetical protein
MENISDELWLGNITVGTPAQGPFPVVLDTGSANLWVPDISCSDVGCTGKPRYDATKSTSASPNGLPFFLPYGTGYCAGTFVNDTVNLGGAEVPNTPCGQATVVAKFFADYPLAGILGLAFSSISIPPDVPTAFDVMVASGVVDQALFAVYLSNHGDQSVDSTIQFGGFDAKYIAPGGVVSYHPVAEPSYWLISMNNTYVNGKVSHACLAGYCPVVVDTGTSVIAAPKAQLQPMIDAIGPVKADCSNVGSLPMIAFELNGQLFELGPQFYVIKDISVNGTQCILGMETIPAIEAGPIWILGDPFLRAYYTIYDKSTDPPRVGIAPAVQPST